MTVDHGVMNMCGTTSHNWDYPPLQLKLDKL